MIEEFFLVWGLAILIPMIDDDSTFEDWLVWIAIITPIFIIAFGIGALVT